METITNHDCIMRLQKSLDDIEEYIDSLESGTLEVIRSGMNMKYQNIESAKLQYALTKGALVAMLDYDHKFGKIIEDANS